MNVSLSFHRTCTALAPHLHCTFTGLSPCFHRTIAGCFHGCFTGSVTGSITTAVTQPHFHNCSFTPVSHYHSIWSCNQGGPFEIGPYASTPEKDKGRYGGMRAGPYARSLTVCSQRTSVPVHPRRLPLPGLTPAPFLAPADCLLVAYQCARAHPPHPPPWPCTPSLFGST